MAWARREPLGYRIICGYLRYLHPVLAQWRTEGITSLTQVTATHVGRALAGRRGVARYMLLAALRSLFKALRHQQLVSQDPTRGQSAASVRRPRRSIHADRLRGLLDHAPTAFGRLVLALVAVHALRPLEVTRLLLEDLDLHGGRLTVRRPGGHHILYLEDLTHTVAGEWMTYRGRRWPQCANPHLLVSAQTALDPDHPPVHITALKPTFPSLDPRMSQLAGGPDPRRGRRIRGSSAADQPLLHRRLNRLALPRHRPPRPRPVTALGSRTRSDELAPAGAGLPASGGGTPAAHADF
ncbi:hypothetical protein ACGFWD_44365 [Streptomyces sp. NPDC048448]|uniref:hypothetical protein n=1 Tax=Streptomyces sp. NPDC048448 TaxID=3365554 RepID=UPI003710FF9B